ncbi:MAG: glutaredoxin family protein [Neptuniibacter sp.]
MIEVLGHKDCSYCKRAIQYLASKGKSFSYLDAREDDNGLIVAKLKSEGVSEVPQIWIDGERIGGFNELKAII